MNTSIQTPLARQLALIDLLLQIAAFAISFGVIVCARQSKSIWAIQAGTMLLGVACWIPMLRRPSVRRVQLFAVYFCWWIVASWFLTYVLWASAFGRDFWVPQIIAFGNVGYVLCRFVLLPISLAVVAIGVMRSDRESRAWTSGTMFIGCLQVVICTVMEIVGLIRW